ncbi:response regulator [bacterium]|nr:response regulator [bacterium]
MPTDKKLKVLLLEDDPDNALAIEMIKEEEWTIHRERHPFYADASTINKYDIVLVDIVYNIKNDDLTKIPSSWIHESVFIPAKNFIEDVLKINPKFPIVLLTALTKLQVLEHSNLYDLGANMIHIEKPVDFDSEEFNNTIDEFLEKSSKL